MSDRKEAEKKSSKGRKLIVCGKTKTIFECKKEPGQGYFVANDLITKNDDPSQTEKMSQKGVWATATTCNVFQLLKDAGLPVAFTEQTGKREFLAPICKMINLEVIIRRNAVGSFLKRSPHLTQSEGEPPLRFHSLVFELFLKTTGGKIVDRFGDKVGKLPIDPSKKKKLRLDDPFISNPYDKEWNLYWPKKPAWEVDANLGISIEAKGILPPGVTVKKIEELARFCFLVLERAWAIACGDRLIDYKIEFGITPDGELMITDVIDNDSWRKRDRFWTETSKQLFRDDEKMELIAYNYKKVAELSKRLRIPEQALIVWRGSDRDPLVKIPDVSGVNFVDVIESGHKKPVKASKKLESILNAFPEGGVIIAEVGMSNGLGPILAARTSWQVISWAVSSKSFPEDIWSSVRMPSHVPNVTVMGEKNAVLAAFNVLSLGNPAAYAHRQLAIEKLDD